MRQPSNLTFRDRTGRRGFPQREWHRLHKAFQRATLHTTLCSVADSSKRLWINCGGCERNEYVETHEWAVRHKVDFDTPILLINPRLRCSKCGERKVMFRSEPYDNLKDST